MANHCQYQLMAIARNEEPLERLMSIMREEDSEYFICRVYCAEVDESEEDWELHEEGDFWTVKFSGSVAWSCSPWVEDKPDPNNKAKNGATYTNLPTICKLLGIALEIWAEEEGVGFQQHIVIDNLGNVVKFDTEDVEYIYPDFEEDPDGEVEQKGGFDRYRCFNDEPIDSIWNDREELEAEEPKPAKKTAKKKPRKKK